MKYIKQLLACVAILDVAFSTAVLAAPEKEKAVETQKTDALKVERAGDKVTLTWTLPEGEWTGIDILRNDNSKTKGRKKLKFVKASTTRYVDTLPEASENYWYWLKVVDKNKKSLNIGPVQAK